MREIKKINSLIIYLVFYGIISSCSSVQTNGFFIKDAKLEQINKINKMNSQDGRMLTFHASNHRITAGKGIVIGYREFDSGNKFVIDDEKYRKITIYFIGKNELHLGEYEINENVIAIYSKGASAWTKSGSYYKIKEGKIFIQKITKQFIELKFIWSNNLKKEESIKGEFTKIFFSELTPWLGKKGTNEYSETYFK